MWDSASLRAMNEAADLVAKHGGVKRTETVYNIGPHHRVDSKTYGDGHTLLTCEDCRQQALEQKDLAEKNCRERRRPAGWG